jgi:hypothetical protein
LHGKLLLTDLIDSLINYSDILEFKTEFQATSTMLKQACYNSSMLVMVEDARVRDLATGFALDIIESQAAQETQYSVQQLPSAEGAPGSSADALDSTFIVKRIQTSDQSTAWDEQSIRAADFGMGLETDGDRVTTLTSCSCQFPTSYG